MLAQITALHSTLKKKKLDTDRSLLYPSARMGIESAIWDVGQLSNYITAQ